MSKIQTFYFTEPDPDFSIKGSRDPLGFQVIWQNQAKKLIPFLSTVSNNLSDFQIMSLTYYLYRHFGFEPDTAFINFFIKFEQVMAYARYFHDDKVFNGTRKVASKLNEEKEIISISTAKDDQILTNQRAYGIWGKYNRPYQEIAFLKSPDFFRIYEQKIETLPNKESFLRLIKKLIEKDSIKIKREDLAIAYEALDYTKEELSFYTTNVLSISNPTHLQNKLFKFFSTNDGRYFSYSLLYSIKEYFSSDEAMSEVINEIEATENILSPASRMFRYLQTKPLWTKEQIDEDAFISKCKVTTGYVFPLNSEANKIKNYLTLQFQSTNWELVCELVMRNKKVTSEREGAPWMSVTNTILDVHHAEGAFYDKDYDPHQDHDNDYFINTYNNLYTQVQSLK